MNKITLTLVFSVGFLFLCLPQLLAVENDESSWIDFFSLLPSEEPVKIDTATNHDTDSIIEKSVIKEDSLVKTEPPAPKLLLKDIVQAPPKKSVVQENNLVDPLLLFPRTLNKNMVSLIIPPYKTGIFLIE